MSANINVTRNFPALDTLVLTTAEDMREVGLFVRERIYTRTISGNDADGAPFAPYSAEYAKRKTAALGTATVNLQVSGNMLNHMQIVEVDGESVTLGWEQ